MDPAYNIGEAAESSQIVIGNSNTLTQKNIATNIEKYVQAAPQPKATGKGDGQRRRAKQTICPLRVHAHS
ncbi:MAG: hypothetical protein AAF171_04510 [Cyanobacteria bacterium P01_A01_bin.116]